MISDRGEGCLEGGLCPVRCTCSCRRLPCNTHKVDAIPVAVSVRQVVTQMRAGEGHGFPVGQAAHVVPHHLLVAEAGPAVRGGLRFELGEGSAGE